MGNPVKGRADFWAPGDWNAACAQCGRKRKASQMVRNWQGLYRCPEHNEPRQPQDYAKGIPERIGTPWAQPQTDNFVTTPLTIPVAIIPKVLALLTGTLFLGSEAPGDGIVLTESGNFLITETAFIGQATVILPLWVIPVSFAWSWQSGGAGIFIDSPTLSSTLFQSLNPGNSGIAQCVVTSSLGGVGVATVAVSS